MAIERIDQIESHVRSRIDAALADLGAPGADFPLQSPPKPELGDYAVVLAESFPIEAGTTNTFQCPICHSDLTSPVDDHLVHIIRHEPDGTQSRVDFSRVAGEHATFVRGPRGLDSFGEHAQRYENLNFFGAGDDLL